MAKIKVLSFAKINLSIDCGKVDNEGFHEVDMLMQQLSFHDDVTVEYEPFDAGKRSDNNCKPEDHMSYGSFDLAVATNRYYLPTDDRNLATKAAKLMVDEFGVRALPGSIKIDILKRIPVAGGLAGGSGNGTAVLHALNKLWKLDLALEDIMDLSKRLGSDCPFCAMGQARGNHSLSHNIRKSINAASCARARGRGDELIPMPALDSWVVIAKPWFSISTKEVYEGIDSVSIAKRPDNDALVRDLADITSYSHSAAENNDLHAQDSDKSTVSEMLMQNKNAAALRDLSDAIGSSGSMGTEVEIYRNFVNVLENYTLIKYPEVAKLKKLMQEQGSLAALMSGSGPTVFGLFPGIDDAMQASDAMRGAGYEAYWTRTIL